MSVNKDNAISNTAILPVWLDPKVFTSKDFTSRNYILELKHLVPLDTLSTHLENYLQQLKQQLVDVINDNYNDFISLGVKLSGVEGAVIRSRKPLIDLKDQIEEVEGKLSLELKELNKILKKKKHIVNIREKFELMQDTYNIFYKVERLMSKIKNRTKPNTNVQSSILDRAAGEIGKLEILLDKGKDLLLICNLQKQVDPLRLEVISQLEICLESTLKENNINSSLRLFHAFSLMSESRVGESVFRKTIIRPLVTDNINKFSTLSEDTKGGLRFGDFVNEFLNSLNIAWGSLIEKIMNSDSGIQFINILDNCIISEISKQLQEQHPEAFSLNVKKDFHDNFNAALNLVEGLVKYCNTVNCLESFVSSFEVSEFLNKWDLNKFTSKCLTEISRDIDDVLNSNDIVALEGEAYFLVPSQKFFESILSCFDKKIFIERMADAFLKFTFILLSKFEIWVQRQIMHITNKQNNEISNQGEIDTITQVSLENLICLHADIDTLVSSLILSIPEIFTNAVMTKDSPILDILSDLKTEIKNIADKYMEMQKDVVNCLINTLGGSCSVKIKKCVGTAVSTIFRLSTDIPTSPNDYVSDALIEPLTKFLSSLKHGKSALSADLQYEISQGVARNACLSYLQALNDMFAFWEKSRTSLQRINRARLGDDESNKADLANSYIQHSLDVEKFGKVLRGIGIDIEYLDEYLNLKKLVSIPP